MVWAELVHMLVLFLSITLGLLVVRKLRTPARRCPDCGNELPFFRTPQNCREALLGGWTCPQCGLQLDRFGRRLIQARQ
jgi:predicted RNA-binding Zn-ribbon protein involved in translation (DUF1610 family)